MQCVQDEFSLHNHFIANNSPVTRLRMEPCELGQSEGRGHGEAGAGDQLFYLSLLISLSCLSIIGLVLLFTRRKLAQIISQLR